MFIGKTPLTRISVFIKKFIWIQMLSVHIFFFLFHLVPGFHYSQVCFKYVPIHQSAFCQFCQFYYCLHTVIITERGYLKQKEEIKQEQLDEHLMETHISLISLVSVSMSKKVLFKKKILSPVFSSVLQYIIYIEDNVDFPQKINM